MALKSERILKIVEMLIKEYPDEKLDLVYRTPFELLISAVLAAQARDEVVNKCTARLFEDFGSPEKLSKATPETLKQYISKINFWRRKAKIIIDISKQLLKYYGGNVPDDKEKLMSLKGVGSKTANMVLGGAFSKPAVIVDTHFAKISKRLGIVSENMSAEDIEEFIRGIVPPEKQTPFSLAMIRHGKKVCHAKNPKCDVCVIMKLCEFPKRNIKGKRKG